MREMNVFVGTLLNNLNISYTDILLVDERDGNLIFQIVDENIQYKIEINQNEEISNYLIYNDKEYHKLDNRIIEGIKQNEIQG